MPCVIGAQLTSTQRSGCLRNSRTLLHCTRCTTRPLSVALFFASAWMLNPLALALSPVALAIVLAYSYTKRFTALSHLVLGVSRNNFV